MPLRSVYINNSRGGGGGGSAPMFCVLEKYNLPTRAVLVPSVRFSVRSPKCT